MSDINPIHISNGIASAAEQATITIEDLVSRMSQSGMSQKAIFDQLISDLDNNGPLFGAFKNKVKSTVRDGIEINFNQSADQIFENAGVQEYRWVAGSNSKPCPDCALRHGEVGSMQYFEAIGKPCSGFSVCGSACKCKLVPVDYTKEDVTKPITKDKIIAKPQKVSSYVQGLSLNQKALLSKTAEKKIREYTDVNIYQSLNEALRDGDYNVIIGARGAGKRGGFTVKKYTQDLTKSLDRLAIYDDVVYRGMNLGPDEFLEFRSSFKGKSRWTNKGFMSTSASERVMEDYMDEGMVSEALGVDGVKVSMAIKNKSGRIIGNYSDFADEKEVLFSPGKKFKVLKYKEEFIPSDYTSGSITVELEEI